MRILLFGFVSCSVSWLSLFQAACYVGVVLHFGAGVIVLFLVLVDPAFRLRAVFRAFGDHYCHFAHEIVGHSPSRSVDGG